MSARYMNFKIILFNVYAIVSQKVPYVIDVCEVKLNLGYTTIFFSAIFSSPVQIYRKSYCTTLIDSIGGNGVRKMLKFYVQVFFLREGQCLVRGDICTQTGLAQRLLSGLGIAFP